ncbi:O-antigen ligase family protein [Flavobacterium sp. J49]|uniref:O-antigen ligase family protein n=1 Tax=Flavobacterium sp. J49 TaxID=2718534 RepID=UPI001E5A4AD1|nr:O-antigen ligase family protein [Flavobacterium sp. J49]
MAKVYALLIVAIGLYYVIKSKNKNHEVLYVAAYIVGSEVLLRTTQGNPFHEYGRYFVLLFVLIGLYYSGFSKRAYPYWLFLLFLIPSILIAINSLLFSFIYYRGLLTFSRGGMITAIAMVVLLVFFILFNYKKYLPVKLKLVVVSLVFPLIFILGSCQTDGLLFKRYNNQNPSGLYKSYETEGRKDIALDEINQFTKNPIMGVGVGKKKKPEA